jgi:anti-sigma B factor antagonist
MHESSDIDIEIVERDGVVVVVVQGEVDLYAASKFEASLTRARASRPQSIVVDVDRVDFMDSAGVHVLLQFWSSQRNGTRLALTPGSPQVRRLLEVTGARRYLPLAPSPGLSPG